MATEPRDTEFRGSVPRKLLELIDACAQVEGLGRMEWAISVLQPEVERRLHAATLLCRIAGVNPTSSDRGAE